MDDNYIDLIKKIYSHSMEPIVIVNENFDILWSSDAQVQNEIDNINFKGYFTNSDINDCEDYNNMIIPITINESNYTMVTLSLYDDEKICGYLIRFVSIKQLFRHTVNKGFSNYQIELFSYVRTQISGIISTVTLLQDCFERKDMYDELKLLNNQVNYCYKILATTINPTELTKYSYNMHNIVRLDAGKFLKEIVNYITSLLRGTDIAVTFSCEQNVYINIDTDRLVVVLMNLIVSSVKNNIEERKEVNISLKSVNDYAVLTISDNGNGLSSSDVSEIFKNSFASMDLTEDDENKKYERGFQVMNAFCRSFNAIMYLSTKENYGTTVSLKIPLSTEEDFPEYLESKTSDYMMNRFSNIYISISQIATINYI